MKDNIVTLIVPVILIVMGLMVLIKDFNLLGGAILIGIGAMIWYQTKDSKPNEEEYELVKVVEE